LQGNKKRRRRLAAPCRQTKNAVAASPHFAPEKRYAVFKVSALSSPTRNAVSPISPLFGIAVGGEVALPALVVTRNFLFAFDPKMIRIARKLKVEK
jgi:hypothetical protein